MNFQVLAPSRWHVEVIPCGVAVRECAGGEGFHLGVISHDPHMHGQGAARVPSRRARSAS